MIFDSNLFYLFILTNIFLDNSLGHLQMNFDANNECSVTIETDNGLQTCFNQKCSDFKDPWRIVNTHLDDKPCYVHYLKLAFSNYDQFIVFTELQQTDNYSIEKFFAQDSKLCMLEVTTYFICNLHRKSPLDRKQTRIRV
jgi:hypothetical protein